MAPATAITAQKLDEVAARLRRNSEEAVGNDAEGLRRKEKPEVTHVGDVHLVLVRSKDPRNHEVVRAGHYRHEVHPVRLPARCFQAS